MRLPNSVMLEILHNRKGVVAVIPSDKQLQILDYMKSGNEFISPDVSLFFNISLVNASGQLRSLYRKGWLTRRAVVDPTGGKMFKYKIIFVPEQPTA